MNKVFTGIFLPWLFWVQRTLPPKNYLQWILELCRYTYTRIFFTEFILYYYRICGWLKLQIQRADYKVICRLSTVQRVGAPNLCLVLRVNCIPFSYLNFSKLVFRTEVHCLSAQCIC